MVTSYAGWGVLLSFEQLVFDIILRHFKEVEVISVSCTANQNQRAENEKKKKVQGIRLVFLIGSRLRPT